MTAEEFESAIRTVALASPICHIPSVRRSSASAVNLRIQLTNGDFIDIFYNEVSDTTAYALISGNRRIYGADNTGGWHFHPFGTPEVHIPLVAPLPFAEFLVSVEKQIQSR
ncbi:MAG: hypothetical protein HY328_02025 [Chloroflexi bacterium]|nr:hypothetical protein [Chloroflexota bacterium]